MNKIIKLTKIFLCETYQKTDIINERTGKINKKSIFIWLIGIIFIAIILISQAVIKYLVKINHPEIFLNVYLTFVTVLLSFQAVLLCVNVFYFSKDLEKVLHFPIKPLELLIAKFNCLLFISYITELILMFVPLILYGMLTQVGLLFYIYELIVIVLLPISLIGMISIIMMFLMNLSRFVKNKEIFQIIITCILLIIMLGIEFIIIKDLTKKFNGDENNQEEISAYIDKKAEELTKYFPTTKYSINILKNSNLTISIISLSKLLVITMFIYMLFALIGQKTYLKNILKGTRYYKRKNKFDIKAIKESKNIKKIYIEKEFKQIFRIPAFFIQYIFPIVIIFVTEIVLLIFIVPNLNEFMQKQGIDEKGLINFDIQVVCFIVGFLQVIYSFSNISLTSISREGKNAIFIKYIPIDLYKQFWYKSMPQIIINFLTAICLIIIPIIIAKNVNILTVLLIVVLTFVMNIMNSILMVLVDLKRPNLNWEAEYQVIKQNSNKIFQYILTIIVVLILMYGNSIFYELNWNVNICIVIFIILFLTVIILTDRYVNKNKNKIFRNIN